MKESIKIFENAQFGQIRTSLTESGEPLFCLVDVCKALGLTNPRQVKTTLSARGVITNDTPTYNQHGALVMQQMNFITEPNLYKCIFQSRKKEAEQFQDWVCGEVLPSIRKSGGYMVARQDETPEQIMARALMVAKDTIDRQQAALKQSENKNYLLQCQNDALTSMNEGQQRHIKALMPGATFAKAVETSEHSILVGELARIIKQNGVEIGQNRLFQWLRDKGYLCKKGEMYNQPTQKALQMGLFELKKTVITKPNGDSLVTTTTKVTGKGQIYFVNKFLFDAINQAELAKQAAQAKKGGAQ
jgi:anti-repressor protein|nr:MAG: antirepressor protein KilAC domain [Bacteriophage sp.]